MLKMNQRPSIAHLLPAIGLYVLVLLCVDLPRHLKIDAGVTMPGDASKAALGYTVVGLAAIVPYFLLLMFNLSNLDRGTLGRCLRHSRKLQYLIACHVFLCRVWMLSAFESLSALLLVWPSPLGNDAGTVRPVLVGLIVLVSLIHVMFEQRWLREHGWRSIETPVRCGVGSELEQ